MYKLYWAKDSGAFAPQILLEEVAADYQKVILDLDRGDELKPEYLAINPRGQVPALQLADGSLLTESAAMMIQIADNHVEARLMPALGTSARAMVYRWLFYAVANIYEADLRFYYSARYVLKPGCVDSVKQCAIKELDKAWNLLEQELSEGPYVLGKEYSVIDPYLMMLARWHEQPHELFKRCPKLKRLCDTVKQRPAVDKIWAQNSS